jgi:hypothetical protein
MSSCSVEMKNKIGPSDQQLNSVKPEVHVYCLEILFLHHRKHYICSTKTNHITLFREIIAVYLENHMKHINTLCGQIWFFVL